MTGVYETLRSYQGVFALLPEHQKRLFESCQKLNFPCPDLKQELSDLQKVDLWVRVLVHAPDGQVERVIQPLAPWHGSFLSPEIWRVKRVQIERDTPELKHLDTAPQKTAREEAQTEGYDEVLLLNSRGEITEGGITNVFFIQGDQIVTPSQGMLPGIGRSLILKAAKELEIPVIERSVLEKEWDQFDALFLSNAVRGIIPVEAVHPLMVRLAKLCTEWILKRIDNEKHHLRRNP